MRFLTDKHAGFLCIDQYCWIVYKKPNRFQLWLLRTCFGITWRDAK